MEPIVIIYGFASDYCVRAGSRDALKRDYQVVMIKDLSRSVNPETTDHALEEMKQRRVIVLDALDIKTLTISPIHQHERWTGEMVL